MRTQVKTIFECFTHTISILSFLLTLAPSVNLTVDTFPDKRGRLAVSYSFLYLPSSGDGFFVGAISLFCGFTYIKISFISVYFNKNGLFQCFFSLQ